MKKTIFLLSLVVMLFAFAPFPSFAQTVVKSKTNASHKGKDAAIGAGAGAVTGALVGHKKGKSALIGGAVGAGAGYLYGRHKDKKHPKVVHKTKTVSRG